MHVFFSSSLLPLRLQPSISAALRLQPSIPAPRLPLPPAVDLHTTSNCWSPPTSPSFHSPLTTDLYPTPPSFHSPPAVDPRLSLPYFDLSFLVDILWSSMSSDLVNEITNYLCSSMFCSEVSTKFGFSGMGKSIQGFYRRRLKYLVGKLNYLLIRSGVYKV
ncbi:hypothetical protein LINPERPRIM_LOCUS41076 [Linum perenne]